MIPQIDGTIFGSITVDGREYEHDVIIRLDGSVKKRKKKLSKEKTGTSHLMSAAEAAHILEAGAERVIIGTGQYGRLSLTEEAEKYFREHHCNVTALPTPDAVQDWNAKLQAGQTATVGIFHVTC